MLFIIFSYISFILSPSLLKSLSETLLNYFFFEAIFNFGEYFGLSAYEEKQGNRNTADPLGPETLFITILRYILLPQETTWN